MDIRQLTPALSVSAQVWPADMQALKDAGFRSVICNRPDNEGAGQPTFAEISDAAGKVGIKAVYLPIVSGNLTGNDVADFGRALTDLPGPVLAFCRSGTRSTTLWALCEADQRSHADILETARAAGFDMTDVLRRTADRGTPNATDRS